MILLAGINKNRKDLSPQRMVIMNKMILDDGKRQ